MTTVTLWNKWTESAEPRAGDGATGHERRGGRVPGERRYKTTGDSYVVVEPSFLVNVTAIRNWVECPRLYYLNKLSGVPLNYPVVKGRSSTRSSATSCGDATSRSRSKPASRSAHSSSACSARRPRPPPRTSGRTLPRSKAGSNRVGSLKTTPGARNSYSSVRRSASAAGPTPFAAVRRSNSRREEPEEGTAVQGQGTGRLLRVVARGTRRRRRHRHPPLYENSALDRNEETGDLTPAKDFDG